jgi:hypothetical protein
VSDALEIRDDGPLERIGRFARERLELVFPPTLFQHDYLPSQITPNVWEQLLRRTPFVGLAWGKLGPKPGTPANRFVGEASWQVYLAVKNPAGQRARLFGDKQGDGLFKVVRAAIAILHGAPVPGIGTIQVRDAGNWAPDNYLAENMSMAVVDFDCGVGINLLGTLSGIRAHTLSEIDITWSFAGDATDTLVDNIQTGTS